MSFWKGFLFTHSQKIGLLALIGIMSIGLAGAAWIQYWQSQSKEIHLSLDLPNNPAKKQSETSLDLALRPLDINIADSSDWASLKGIGPVLSKRILRYREACQGFQSVEDLRKVYGLKPETFEQIQPFLFVEESTIPKKHESPSKPIRSYGKKKKPTAPIDINQANSETFQQLKGIGPVLGDRIVKYRTAIGGFARVDQIQQVYGLKAEVFEEMKEYLFVGGLDDSVDTSMAHVDVDRDSSFETGAHKRMTSPKNRKTTESLSVYDLNQVDSAQLVQLPGIGAWTAQQILRYRGRIGHYVSTEQLKDIPRLNEKNFQKMLPFLQVPNPDQLPKKDLNRTSEWSLKVHRPIGESMAGFLLKRRKELGRFSSWQELREIEQIDDQTISYLRKYFHL